MGKFLPQIFQGFEFCGIRSQTFVINRLSNNFSTERTIITHKFHL